MPPKKTDKELKFYANIGNKIRKLRIKEKLTQTYLAKNVETSQEVIAGYENGNISIPLIVVKKIADFFNVSVDYLISKSGSLEEQSAKHKIDFEGIKYSVKDYGFRRDQEETKNILELIYRMGFRFDEGVYIGDLNEYTIPFLESILEREIFLIFAILGIKVPFERLFDREIRFNFIINKIKDIYASENEGIIIRFEWIVNLFNFIYDYMLTVEDIESLRKQEEQYMAKLAEEDTEEAVKNKNMKKNKTKSKKD